VDPDNEPAVGRARPGRRRRRRREPVAVGWTVVAALAVAAVWTASWRLALFGVLLWCGYEFLFVPAVCRVMTRQGFSCREPVRGRLFACRGEHQKLKNEALWRLAGRRPAAPGPWVVRARLAQADLIALVSAAAGTVVIVAGTVYGLVR
jgi:hypothetical protein